MVEEAIVAFVDILGYEKIVRMHKNNIKVIKNFEDLIKKTIKLLIKLKDRSIGDTQIEDCRDEIIDKIGVRWISDTFLLTLPSLPIHDNEKLHMSIWLYFHLISAFCLNIIGKTGLILRGGISKGHHYENTFDENLFIFSEVYCNAYNLQKEGEARIVIDDGFSSYLDRISFLNKYPNFFYKDVDEKLCLHFYCFLKNDDESKEVLSDIQKGVSANICENKNNPRELAKLKYFAKYHNRKVEELRFTDLFINH